MSQLFPVDQKGWVFSTLREFINVTSLGQNFLFKRMLTISLVLHGSFPEQKMSMHGLPPWNWISSLELLKRNGVRNSLKDKSSLASLHPCFLWQKRPFIHCKIFISSNTQGTQRRSTVKRSKTFNLLFCCTLEILHNFLDFIHRALRVHKFFTGKRPTLKTQRWWTCTLCLDASTNQPIKFYYGVSHFGPSIIIPVLISTPWYFIF